jgi:hypothetical protein
MSLPFASWNAHTAASVLAAALIGLFSAGAPSPVHAQDAEIQFPITVSTDGENARTLTLGLDPAATDSIDSALGEQEQPPMPPGFDARWVDDHVSASGFGEGLVKDIRQGGTEFTGTKTHEISFKADGDTTLTIAWDLPDGISGTIEDRFGGDAYGPVSMTGRDSLTVDTAAPNAIVTIDYAPNQAPTLDTNTGVTLLEGGSTTLATGDLSASDPDDPPSALTYVVTGGPTRGTLRVNDSPDSSFTQAELDDGSVQYDHTAADATDDSFTFFVEDPEGARTEEASFSIAVDATNDPPSVSVEPASTTIPENNSPPTEVATATVTDDGLGRNVLSLTGPDAGAFALTDAGALQLTEAANFERQRSYAVTVAVNDPDLAPSPNDTSAVSLSIEDVNEPPTLRTNAGLDLSSDASATITTGELSASDPDDGPSGLTYTVTSGPARGILQVDGRPDSVFTQADLASGTVQYTHTGSDPTNDSFTFALSDPGGLGPTKRSFPIAIEPSTHQTTIVGRDGTGNDTGWRLLAPPSNATRGDFEDDLAFDVTTGSLLYTWDGQWTPAADSSTALPRGRGFILYFFDDGVDPVTSDGLTLDIPDLNEGQTEDVTLDNLNPNNALHLLGNPYDVAFDLGELAGGDLSARGFQNTVQVWDPSNGGQWTLITQGGPDDTIPAWQGFFVEREQPGQGPTSLTFRADGRQSGPGDLIGSASPLLSASRQGSATSEPARLDLSLVVAREADTLAREGVRLSFRQQADAGWDPYEATQLPPPTEDTYATLNSPLQRNGAVVRRALASEPIPPRNETTTYPLSVRSVGTAGTATLRWPEASRGALPTTWDVELVDTKTDATVDLRTEAYTFEVADGDGTLDAPADARFALRITSSIASVELTDFSAERSEEGIRLTWQTASETNNEGFSVQRNTGEAEWEELAFIESKTAKNASTGPRSYQFTDENPPYATDSLSYRLQQVDTTGTPYTATALDVGRSPPERVTLRPPFPNPAPQYATLHFGLSEATAVQVSVYDLLGREVIALVDDRFEAGRHTERLSTSTLAPGMYFVRLRASGTTRTRKLTVTR